MGKSSKKSTPKVDAAPVAAIKSAKKGKRGAEEAIDKVVSAKKHKLERDEAVEAKKKLEKKQPKKVETSSSSEDSSSSESDDEPKAVLKKTQPLSKGAPLVTKKADKDSSSESSDSSESDSDVSDEKPKVIKKQPTAALKNVTKKDSSSNEESDSDSDSDSSDEEANGNAGKPSAKASQDKFDSDEESSDESSDEEPSKEKQVKAAAAGNGANVAKKDSSSEEESSDESSDDEPSKAPQAKNAQASKKSSSSEESSDEDREESEEEESDFDHSLKTPKKKDTDVEMVDASPNQTKKSELSTAQKTPKTPTTLQAEATGSKTLFVGNLSFSVEENDVREFFKNAGEVVDVRFASNPEGQFKGFGHVEFAAPEDAQKALELNGEELLNRPVRLDLARERGAYTPHSRENNSYQKGGRPQGLTVFVKGFDTSSGEDKIRSALQEHFGSCGEITRLSIPPDYESGGVKGMAYIDFTDSDGLNNALELNGSEVGGYSLIVQEAKPRGDNRDGSGKGGRSGGRFGGRNSGGRFGGRGGDSGGRFGGRGGGRFGRGGRGGGGRGRGTPNKSNFSATPAGKKTTFADD